MPRIRVSVTCLGERHSLVKFNSKLAIITQALKRPGKGGRMARVKAAYLGFDSYEQAQAVAQDLRRRFPKARLEVRKAERLATAFEAKFSHDVAEQIVWQMLRGMETTGQKVSKYLAVVADRKPVPLDEPSARHRNAPVQKNYGGRATVLSGSRVLGIE